jgi:hypothetical protein
MPPMRIRGQRWCTHTPPICRGQQQRQQQQQQQQQRNCEQKSNMSNSVVEWVGEHGGGGVEKAPCLPRILAISRSAQVHLPPRMWRGQQQQQQQRKLG